MLARHGIPRSSAAGFQAVADDFDIIIKVRPTNTASVPLLAEGAMAKPELIKWKTINRTDTLLGAPADGIGKVGLFEPAMPDKGVMRSLAPEERARITERFKQRADEYADYLAHQDKWKPLIDRKIISVDDGMVRLTDPRTGELRDVAGDHDIYQITHSDGSPLSQDERALVIDQLRSMNINVEHGAHVDWAQDDPGSYSPQMDERIRGRHAGSEPLVVFTPETAPSEAFAGTEVTGPARSSGPGHRFRKLQGNVTTSTPSASPGMHGGD